MKLRRLGLTVSLGLLLSAFALAFSSCKHVPEPVQTGVSAVVDCTKGAVQEAALHILDDAASALATGSWEAGLLDLAKRFGFDAVSCVLSKIRGDALVYASTTSSPDPLEMVKAARANQWLTTHHVVFAGADGGAQ